MKVTISFSMGGIQMGTDEARQHINTIVFDFDGVIYNYDGKWGDIDYLPNGAVAGVKELIEKVRNAGYRVAVVSARCHSKHGTLGIDAIKKWLEKEGIVVDEVSNEKVPALVYIDDRAFKFEGNADIFDAIINFKSWIELP